MTLPARRIVSYPVRGLDVAKLGYNLGSLPDDAHVALAVAGGASLLRTQFSWDIAENYSTGAFAMATAWQAFLNSCAARGPKPIVVAAYGPPRQTIGTLTVTGAVASGSPAGTPIPVQSYGFTIQTNNDAAGGSSFTSSTGVGNLTSVDEWVGMPITFADASSIKISKALNRSLAIGDKINVQRRRYGIPLSNTDPGIAAFGNYVLWIAQQIAAAGCQGYVNIWNEYEWAHDHWSFPNSLYDTGAPSAVGARMGPFLRQLQTLLLPNGVSLINGVTDTSGANSIAGVQVNAPGKNFSYEGAHIYGDKPEYQSWDLYASDSGGYEALDAVDVSSNARGMARSQDTVAGQSWPRTMYTEAGFQTSNDTVQARSMVRRLLNHWGQGGPTCFHIFDDNSAPGANSYAIAPRLTPRPSYNALQRVMQIIGRMSTNRGTPAVPDAVAWNTDAWPLMVSRVRGDMPGHSVLFAWQRTLDADDNTWHAVPSPPAQIAEFSVPPGLQIAECLDTMSGATVTPTGPSNGLMQLPVTDSPVAVRFAPA